MFGTQLDAIELASPEVLVGFDPVMHGLQLLCIEPVEAQLASFADGDDAHLAQDSEMLGDGGLVHAEAEDDVVDLVIFAVLQEADDLAAAGFGDGGEDVGGGGGARHEGNCIFHYENMSRTGRLAQASAHNCGRSEEWDSLDVENLFAGLSIFDELVRSWGRKIRCRGLRAGNEEDLWHSIYFCCEMTELHGRR